MKYIIVIPARYNSSRLPGKPLLELKGKSMLQRVYEKCKSIVKEDFIYVATDDSRIKDHCDSFNMQCLITSKECLTGTDRVAEVSKIIKADYYINVQGDEPVFNPGDINLLIKSITDNSKSFHVYGGYCKIETSEKFFSKNIPKVVFNNKNELLYMSRAGIPSNKIKSFNFGYRQVCAYAFSAYALQIFSSQSNKTIFESEEDIEILRFLELGVKVKMLEMSNDSISIDIPEDINEVLNSLKND